MFKKLIIIVLVLFTISISGCTTKTASNGTFGEKTISINSIYLSNNTTADVYNGTDTGLQYYYIGGYLINNNSNDAFNVKILATAYDKDGNVVATNESAYLYPSSIPAKGSSEFYVDFPDNNSNIVRYEVKILSARGTL
ncbi:MAG: FxLYD domain-containing protein [Methanobacterium sp. ERen5]|nr:MAG: FxLYD domain-containing protein [Methanobacterium sp. ERen5]